MSAERAAQKDGAQQADKKQQGEGDLTDTLNAVTKISKAWLQYVKAGLFGAKEEGEGAEEKVPEKVPEKPKPTVETSKDPEAKTVHDGKEHKPEYADVGNEVFKGKPQMKDVQQGYLCDCYLIAAIASVAAQRPDLIEKMIIDHGDGTATVMLYETSGGLAPPGSGKPTPVRVSLKMPSVDGKKPTYAKGADKQLWPAIIEKAYVVKIKGGKYQGANTGGNAGSAMEAMLGAPSDSFATSSKKPVEIVTDLQKLIELGKPVAAGSFGKDEAKGNAALKKIADEKNVHAWHAYTVISADAKANAIKLYNPWGSSHPETLTGEEFKTLYRNVYVGNPKAPDKKDLEDAKQPS